MAAWLGEEGVTVPVLALQHRFGRPAVPWIWRQLLSQDVFLRSIQAFVP